MCVTPCGAGGTGSTSRTWSPGRSCGAPVSPAFARTARSRAPRRCRCSPPSRLEVNALYRLRQAQGVVALAEKHGAERLDAACRRAIEIGDPEYRTVKGIL